MRSRYSRQVMPEQYQSDPQFPRQTRMPAEQLQRVAGTVLPCGFSELTSPAIQAPTRIETVGWADGIQKAQALAAVGDIRAAQVLSEQLYNHTRPLKDKYSHQHCVVTWNLAPILELHNNYSQATALWHEALETAKTLNPSHPTYVPRLEIYLACNLRSLQRGNRCADDAADSALAHHAISVLEAFRERAATPEAAQYAAALIVEGAQRFAGSCDQQHHLATKDQFLILSYERAQSYFGIDSSRALKLRLELSQHFCDSNRHERASQLLIHALNGLREKGADGAPLLAAHQARLSQVLIEMRNYAGAQRAAVDGLAVLHATPEDSRAMTATVLYRNLGTIAHEIQNYETAKSHFTQAINHQTGTVTTELLNDYHTLASIHEYVASESRDSVAQVKERADAEECFLKAFELAVSCETDEPSWRLICAGELVRFYIRREKLTEADEFAAKSQQFAYDHYGPASPEYRDALIQRAHVAQEIPGCFGRTEGYLLKALQVCKQHPKDHISEALEISYELAWLAIQQELPSDACLTMADALVFAEAHCPATSLELAHALVRAAHILCQAQKFSDARRYCLHAIEIHQVNSIQQSADLAQANHILGCCQRGEPGSGSGPMLKQFRIARRMFKELELVDSIPYGLLARDLGYLHADRFQNSCNEKLLDSAYAMLEEAESILRGTPFSRPGQHLVLVQRLILLLESKLAKLSEELSLLEELEPDQAEAGKAVIDDIGATLNEYQTYAEQLTALAQRDAEHARLTFDPPEAP